MDRFSKALKMEYSKKFNTTFGSIDSDDSYYLEYRTDDDRVYSFLSFDISTNDIITVHIGKGKDAIRMPLEEMKTLVREAEDRLRSAMSDWKGSSEYE